jgi:membrane glycosyltransferase
LRPAFATLRRALFLALVVVTIVLAVGALYEILRPNGLEPLEIAIIVLFTFNFIWIALSFWTAVAGFLIRLLKRDPINLRPISRLLPVENGAIASRTAVIVPVYNEDPHRVYAGLEAVYRSLQATGHLAAFDFFILSDTRSDEIAAAERRYWHDMCDRLNGGGRIFYRRREHNTRRKVGNVSEFLSRWGYRYEYMIVFDADSIMSGQSMVDLVRLMEANPHAGLIQTNPMAINQTTLFGRAQQFAGRVAGPVLASGMSFWHMGEANYFGHNAVIRTRAFIDQCGLPPVPGRPPLGGEIHSHDYVEAALLRRGGWFVYLMPDFEGSYEELPSNIIDFAVRDRRWCQGNLQHLRLLGAQRLHWMSRFHFIIGAFAYLSSFIWVAFLVLSTANVVEEAVTGHQYFSQSYQLFPEWPISKIWETVSLFAVTMAMLFLPKVFGLILVLTDKARRRAFGGGPKAALGVLCECLFSVLIAPVMGGLHSYFVVSLVIGRGVNWNPQNRSERGLSVREASTSVGIFFALGIGWLAALLAHAPSYVWWVLPVLAGLVLAVPVTVLSSRSTLGLWLKDRSIFLTPEEYAPPPELRMLAARLDRDPLPATDEPPDPEFPETPEAKWTPIHEQVLWNAPAKRDPAIIG